MLARTRAHAHTHICARTLSHAHALVSGTGDKEAVHIAK